MSKVKTLKDILSDKRIESFVKNYDGYGKHMVECKPGYRFEANSSTIEVGSISEICDEINERLYNEILVKN